jgi:hypothetical protein
MDWTPGEMSEDVEDRRGDSDGVVQDSDLAAEVVSASSELLFWSV